MTVELKKIYYLRGTQPKHWTNRYRIKDPPTAGYQRALLHYVKGRCVVLCPYTLESWNVPDDAGELSQAESLEVDAAFWTKWLQDRWRELYARDAQRDYHVVAMFLDLLGAKAPNLRDVKKQRSQFSARPRRKADGEGKQKSKGKETITAKLRAIKPTGRRADVARFFLEEASVPAAMAKLGMTRSGVLSHLYCINRDHGLGYELLDGDAARLVVPKGHEVFDK